jgi:hypothetical protein
LHECFAQPFTAGEAARKDSKSKTTVQGWLTELHEAGLVDIFEPYRGNQGTKWVSIKVDESSVGRSSVLPTSQTVREASDRFAQQPQNHGETASEPTVQGESDELIDRTRPEAICVGESAYPYDGLDDDEISF